VTERDGWELVAAAQAGDRAAFADLYTRHRPAVYRYVAARVYDSPTAEDFTSETFARALGAIGTVRYQGRDIRAWLIVIARHVIYDDSKSARRRLEVVTDDLSDSRMIRESGGETPDCPEDAVLGDLDAQQVRAAVARMSGDQRQVLELRFFAGLSVAEAAEAMWRSVGAVKALQHRAVRTLADLMAAEQVGPDSPAWMLMLLDEDELQAALHRIRVALARRHPDRYRAGPDGEIVYIGPRAIPGGDR
jgi:RNA polymerase sigma-70 factor, ECF subfamily